MLRSAAESNTAEAIYKPRFGRRFLARTTHRLDFVIHRPLRSPPRPGRVPAWGPWSHSKSKGYEKIESTGRGFLFLSQPMDRMILPPRPRLGFLYLPR